MTQEALKLTLEFVESINLGSRSASVEQQRQAITALRKALAQPEQEPYGIALTNIPHPQGVSAPDDLNADALEVVELELPDECEAVGWADDGVINWIADKQFKHASFLYPTPPQRKWVGLTDEEMEATFLECGGKWNGDFWKIEDADFHPFLRTIEAKLKEKNT